MFWPCPANEYNDRGDFFFLTAFFVLISPPLLNLILGLEEQETPSSDLFLVSSFIVSTTAAVLFAYLTARWNIYGPATEPSVLFLTLLSGLWRIQVPWYTLVAAAALLLKLVPFWWNTALRTWDMSARTTELVIFLPTKIEQDTLQEGCAPDRSSQASAPAGSNLKDEDSSSDSENIVMSMLEWQTDVPELNSLELYYLSLIYLWTHQRTQRLFKRAGNSEYDFHRKTLAVRADFEATRCKPSSTLCGDEFWKREEALALPLRPT
ncbi:hypothetical protein DFH09DRAFT_1418610 [Mycena vulgaris]|nr:hypothetical protein DFH09DRAFT_1418610 [Mycena vulgaris]